MAGTESTTDPRKVFVIHGRNDSARRGLFDFLRAVGLDPIEWAEALALTGSASPYIGDVLDHAFGVAQAVVVLQTPDDVAHLHESLAERADDPETQPQMQPRPNVLFEAGMAMGRSPERTVLVELGHIKSFSDVHGRHSVRLNNTVGKRQDLANRLLTAGCAVKLTGTDWHEAGDLTPPASPGNGLPLGKKLPSSATNGEPRLSATLRVRGGNKLSDIIVTNHGPGDVYDLNVQPEDEGQHFYREDGVLPVPRLPAGKSVVALQRMPPALTESYAPYFTLRISGKTADGTPIEQDEFVSES
ncbi:hypothetical protein GCM10009706_26580 [Curtobacterium citreum]|uniref:Nucleotide-binding protein n=1 Tax=Curtobacterium citreum TaxID=2036 RepID=A0ABT2HKP7_9MICO|nr:nucleotide-binding protein [Curtobacterium citreum]MCS6523845.1 nucleotide-binding protein [Curtobacterium citreum]TQJ26363.1 putative nucleotide-binding protein with TIR-like domain [Curtobacterium citreum]GGL86558.1 hypothetical protein GCM10009706_26580 [Curtobacterium citreum]